MPQGGQTWVRHHTSSLLAGVVRRRVTSTPIDTAHDIGGSDTFVGRPDIKFPNGHACADPAAKLNTSKSGSGRVRVMGLLEGPQDEDARSSGSGAKWVGILSAAASVQFGVAKWNSVEVDLPRIQ